MEGGSIIIQRGECKINGHQSLQQKKKSIRHILFFIIKSLYFFVFLTTASERSTDVSSESLAGGHGGRTGGLTELIHNILSLSEIDGFQAGPQLHLHILDHAPDVGDMGVLVIDGAPLLGLWRRKIRKRGRKKRKRKRKKKKITWRVMLPPRFTLPD